MPPGGLQEKCRSLRAKVELRQCACACVIGDARACASGVRGCLSAEVECNGAVLASCSACSVSCDGAARNWPRMCRGEETPKTFYPAPLLREVCRWVAWCDCTPWDTSTMCNIFSG